MTEKGEGSRAIGAALTSSVAGGIVTVFFALAMVPLLLPVIMGIYSADMVFVILLGLLFVAVLAGRSVVKGLISGALGLLISFIGFQVVTGVSRFTFGSPFLYDGISLIPVALGLFAIPEIIDLAVRAKDVFRHWGLWLRSSIIGYIVGVIPGIGGDVAVFVAYGQAKQTAKHPERFGTGIVEGVIAPESANNAKEAGALLTTLALGIPGSASMALLLGAFVIVGLVPGPAMMTEHLDLSLTLFLVIIAANIIAAAICFLAAPHLLKIAIVPSRILAPLVIVIALVGVFASRQQFADVIITLVISGLGLALKKFGYSRPALLLAFVLGGLFEQYLYLALAASGPLFFLRPVSLTLIFIMVTFFSFRPLKSLFARWFKKGARIT